MVSTISARLFLIWVTIIGTSVSVTAEFVVDSSNKPFESSFLIRKEITKDINDHSSPSFQLPDDSGVSWRYRFYRGGKTERSDSAISLELLSLPRDTSYVEISSLNCSFSSKPKAWNFTATTTTENLFIVTGRIYPTTLATFSPDSESTDVALKCDVQGTLGVTDLTEKHMNSFTDEKDRCEIQIRKMRERKYSLPSNPKASKNTVTLKARGKEFPCYRYVLRKAAPTLIPETPAVSGNYEFDFGEEITAFELEDLVHFMNSGSLVNMDQTCPKLIPVAAKYKIDCLDIYCAEKGDIRTPFH